MKNIFTTQEVSKETSEKARRIIENRTGHPQGLLTKTKEVLEKKFKI
jgi:hypothetical protein